MEYKVPQNIDVEDRVVGPLTLRQFFIIMGGAMICLVLYVALSFFKPLFYLVAALIMGGAATLAFANYGDQHPEKIFLSAISTFTSPRRRVWKRVVTERELNEVNRKDVEGPKKTGAELSEKKPEVDFDRLSKIIDTGSFSDDEVKGKMANLGEKKRIAETPGLADAIQPASKEVSGVDNLLSKVQKGAKKFDPLVSQLATVSPSKLFKYDKIDKSGAIEEPVETVPTK